MLSQQMKKKYSNLRICFLHPRWALRDVGFTNLPKCMKFSEDIWSVKFSDEHGFENKWCATRISCHVNAVWGIFASAYACAGNAWMPFQPQGGLAPWALLNGACGFDKLLDFASSNSGLYVFGTVHAYLTNFRIILLIIPTYSTTQGYTNSGLYIHIYQTDVQVFVLINANYSGHGS